MVRALRIEAPLEAREALATEEGGRLAILAALIGRVILQKSSRRAAAGRAAALLPHGGWAMSWFVGVLRRGIFCLVQKFLPPTAIIQ
jgi:hypothetical protein